MKFKLEGLKRIIKTVPTMTILGLIINSNIEAQNIEPFNPDTIKILYTKIEKFKENKQFRPDTLPEQSGNFYYPEWQNDTKFKNQFFTRKGDTLYVVSATPGRDPQQTSFSLGVFDLKSMKYAYTRDQNGDGYPENMSEGDITERKDFPESNPLFALKAVFLKHNDIAGDQNTFNTSPFKVNNRYLVTESSVRVNGMRKTRQEKDKILNEYQMTVEDVFETFAGQLPDNK